MDAASSWGEAVSLVCGSALAGRVSSDACERRRDASMLTPRLPEEGSVILAGEVGCGSENRLVWVGVGLEGKGISSAVPNGHDATHACGVALMDACAFVIVCEAVE